MGGTDRPAINHPTNLLLLCGTGTTGCHGWVESNRDTARAQGYLVASWEEPETVPFFDLVGRIWLLDGLTRIDVTGRWVTP